MFKVYATETYLREIDKWPVAERVAAEIAAKKLAESPLQGKPLNYPFLREKKIGGRRVYYLVYNDLKLVLLVAVSGKKDQQDTINHVKSHLDEFKNVAQEKFKQFS